MSNRPFETGDMVVSELFGICTVIKVRIDDVKVKTTDDDEICFSLNGNFLVNEEYPDIKTIRKPRKGGKEARDIVAMLARSYKHELSKILRLWGIYSDSQEEANKDYWKKRKSGGFIEKNKVYLNFQKAKLMLGDHNENN